MRRLLADAAAHGAGRRYLIQHSAGSGKSNSIAWLAHQLIGLERNNSAVFDSILVVTDRRILDPQIKATIKQFAQVDATVGHAEDSGGLRKFIAEGKKIITTVQKFPFILDEIGNEQRGRRFAIVCATSPSSFIEGAGPSCARCCSGSCGGWAYEAWRHMSSTAIQLTQVTVRALALGGKFIGDGVGYATVTISQGSRVLAKGTTSEGTPRFSDGSGITGLIMAEPYPWGAPVRADDATSFTASLSITVPTLITITVQAPASSKWTSQAVTVSAQRWILPGMNLTGQCAVVLVVPGLLVGWNGPPSIASGGAISASVHMMCGCAIDNVFWPGENFDVIANLTPKGGGATTPVQLTWSSTSTFSGNVAAAAGSYNVRVFAVEVLNGNTGSAAGTLTITG